MEKTPPGLVTRSNPGAHSMSLDIRGEGFELVEERKEIRARVGLAFGVEFTVEAPPYLNRVPVRTRWRVPGRGSPLKEYVAPERGSFMATNGKPGISVFEFETDWDLVPGEYRVEILHHGAVLTGMVFRISVPP